MRQEAKRGMMREEHGERDAQGIAMLPGCLFSRQGAEGAKGSLVTPVGDRETAFSKKMGRGKNSGLFGPFVTKGIALNAVQQRKMMANPPALKKAREARREPGLARPQRRKTGRSWRRKGGNGEGDVFRRRILFLVNVLRVFAFLTGLYRILEHLSSAPEWEVNRGGRGERDFWRHNRMERIRRRKF